LPCVFLKVGSKIQPEIAAAFGGSDNTLWGWIRDWFCPADQRDAQAPSKTEQL
jgi:transposase-like protein